jgi:hypothetical protein
MPVAGFHPLVESTDLPSDFDATCIRHDGGKMAVAWVTMFLADRTELNQTRL